MSQWIPWAIQYESFSRQVVKKKISKQDIAKMIGASREMVSRVMKDLGLRGLIEETDGGIILREKIIDL